MPAVQLARLNQQIQALVQHFADPIVFKTELESLLIRYADLTYKPGEGVGHSSLTESSFRTPPIVMRKLELRLAVLAAHNPELALAAADAMWQAEEAEERRLAAVMIGNLPAEYSDQIFQRIQTWISPGMEKSHLEALFELGTSLIRRADPQRWLELIRSWLNSSDLAVVRLGVVGLTALVKDAEFENLPAVFNSIGSLVAETPDTLKYELRLLLVELIHRTPTETGYFLRQIISSGGSDSLMRLARRILPEFPEEIQARLRGVVVSLPQE